MKFEDSDYWKAIILYGLNQATYKIALGKTLLELSTQGQERIDWGTLSKGFLDNYLQRLKENPLPQQANPSRRTVMENIARMVELGQLTYNDAIKKVEADAFGDVIPRFHTIGRDTDMAKEKFYHFDFGRNLYLHDSLFRISEERKLELIDELDARWSLLEGAFIMNHEGWELANDIRDIYLKDGYDRKSLTPNIPFLKGYQGNTCFYCGEPIAEGDIHVDHVLPRQLLMNDEIWNLVLSHSLCNLSKEDSLVGPHYLEKLIARNENVMGSNHPWKKRIADQIGATKSARIKTTKRHYENARIALNGRYWENSPNYNRETDTFYKKLITKLNNG